MAWGGTTGRVFNYWGNNGRDIIKNTRRGNELRGVMSNTGDAYGHRFSGTGTGEAAAAKAAAPKQTMAEKTAAQQATGQARTAARAKAEAEKYIANAKAGGTWSVAEFGKKAQRWRKMGYSG